MNAQKTEMQGKLRLIVLTALFAALTAASTAALVIPLPSGGYLNAGDVVILLGAWLLGPLCGAAAGGVGAALADLMAGYAIYVPATLVIKSAVALAAALLYRATRKTPWGFVLSGIFAELLMVAGYWLYDGMLLKSLAGAAVNIPGNLLQAAVAIAAGASLATALKKIPAIRRQFPRL